MLRHFERSVLHVLSGALIFAMAVHVAAADVVRRVLRAGYFHGGRTALLMRAYENGEFEAKGIDVAFYSKELRGKEYTLVPPSIEEFNKRGEDNVGKATGLELIDGVLSDKFDLAMVGESSFLAAIYADKPIVAIAELGHDVKDSSGHVFLMRKGITVSRREDYLGKLLVSRRAGPGDAICLKEFLEQEGVDLKKDILQLEALPRTLEEKERLPKDKVLIVDNVFEDRLNEGIENGVIDGGYFHLMTFEYESHVFNLIKPLHAWMNPELSHALLVCRKDFLCRNRDLLLVFLEVYMEHIKNENTLTREEKMKPRGKGRRMASNFYGLNYPQYDAVPTVGTDLLYEMLRLLKKYGFVGEKALKIEHYVDNTLVLEIAHRKESRDAGVKR